MAGPGEVRIDGRRGIAQVGDRSVAIELLPDGTLRVGGPAGPRLRRLLFAERDQIVAVASRAPDPHARLRSLLAEACVVERGAGGAPSVEPALLHALCLHLSGAGVPAPDFARVVTLIAEATGWTREQIGRCPADEIDGLAVQLARPAAAPGSVPVSGVASRVEATTVRRDPDGWTRLVLLPTPRGDKPAAPSPGGPGSAEASEQLVERLVAELLRRGAASGTSHGSGGSGGEASTDGAQRSGAGGGSADQP